MNTIIINGQRFQTSGKSISINGDSIIVDKQVIQSGLSGIVQVQFEGELASVKSDGSVTVNGTVHGDVDAGGSVNCQNVQGNVDAGGSVRCGIIQGNVDAGGSIRHQ